MPKTCLLLAILLPAGTTALPAQIDYYLGIGAVGASKLLRDVIVSEIKVRQSVAPMIALGGSLPIRQGYRAGLEATFATGGFHSTENGSETDLGTLRTGTLMLALEGPIGWGVSWRLGLGGIHYFPGDDAGIFQSGGTTRFLAGAGADWRRAVIARWDLLVALRYDYHQFTTSDLQARGFSQSQQVSRFALLIGLAGGRR